MEMIHAFEPSERTSAAGALRPSLLRVVQTEILPRLPLVHRPPRAATTQNESAEPERLANLAFGPDRDGVADYLTFLQRRGASSEALLLDMIAPAARHLGALWEQDLCDFIEVTQGLGRLRAAAQDLLAEPDDPLGRDRADPRVLLTLAPGETHRLGAAIAAGLFRFAGFFLRKWRTVSRRRSPRRPMRRSAFRSPAGGISMRCEARSRGPARPR